MQEVEDFVERLDDMVLRDAFLFLGGESLAFGPGLKLKINRVTFSRNHRPRGFWSRTRVRGAGIYVARYRTCKALWNFQKSYDLIDEPCIRVNMPD